MTPRLLFFSNLFPTSLEPYRGLDNATVLHALAVGFDIRVLSPRPVLPWTPRAFTGRAEDSAFHPRWVPAAYIPKIGGPVNHLLMAGSVRKAFEESLRTFRPDVILSSWIYPDSCAAIRLAGGRLPVVAIAQGSDVHQYLTMAGRRRVILKVLPRAARVVARSGELGRLLGGAGFSVEALDIVYNGVALDTYQPRDKDVARKELGLAELGKMVLFVGNFYAVKDPMLLIRAVGRLGVALVMAGGGPLEGECRELAGKVGARVHFMGRKAPGEIARLMNAADVLAIPSRNEGVPNVLLEAFASGLPVVASRVGGIPEVLDHGALGCLFPSGDLEGLVAALERQLAAPRDMAAIRRHGERFSWEVTAGKYREILLGAMS